MQTRPIPPHTFLDHLSQNHFIQPNTLLHLQVHHQHVLTSTLSKTPPPNSIQSLLLYTRSSKQDSSPSHVRSHAIIPSLQRLFIPTDAVLAAVVIVTDPRIITTARAPEPLRLQPPAAPGSVVACAGAAVKIQVLGASGASEPRRQEPRGHAAEQKEFVPQGRPAEG